MQLPSFPNPGHTWVQTDRKAHEAWGALIKQSPVAAQIMHIFASMLDNRTKSVEEHGPNSVVMSQKNLARLTDRSLRGVQKALVLLEKQNWIQVRQIGGKGSVNAYTVNSRIAWHGHRDNIRHSIFDAVVFISEDEQKGERLENDETPLWTLPTTLKGERQLPSGDGLPPVSQPSFGGFEPDLPSVQRARNDDE